MDGSMVEQITIDGSADIKIATQTNATKKPRTKKPNYNQIHKDALPITLFHAPPLIPHNPLSILYHIYLYIFPSKVSHILCYTAIFDPETLSINVIDPQGVDDLWRKGFFGKGSLSRSEPTWHHRELRRQGFSDVSETSEEITKRRREERKEFKKERAKKEKEDLDRKRKEEAEAKETKDANSLVVTLDDEIMELNKQDPLVDKEDHNHIAANSISEPENDTPNSTMDANLILETVDLLPVNVTPLSEPSDTIPSPSKTVQFVDEPIVHEVPALEITTQDLKRDKLSVTNEEHLQLTFYEAFFLVWALGVLTVTTKDNKPISTKDLFTIFRSYSHFPPLSFSVASKFTPDDPFLINYAVYHRFRSFGWVVRTGIKFAVDFLLYSRGPVFTHAEFALVVIPTYKRWENKDEEEKDWWWLHEVMRVSSQVKKMVVLCYVDVPTLEECKGWDEPGGMGMKGLLSKFSFKEVGMSRWIPNRSRD